MISYREGSVADAPVIATVEVRSKQQSIPDICSGIQMDGDWSRQRWETYLEGSRSPRFALAPRVLYLAYDADVAVGYGACHCTTKRGIDSELQSLYVLKDYQGRGIGTALVGMLAQWAYTAGCRSMLAGFHGDNPYARFYQKLGGDLSQGPCIWHDLEPLLPGPEDV
jgi:GNAT superfamily N-acetyltransferase